MALPKSRTRSIRARIALLLVVPLLSLVVLWGIALNLTVSDARAQARIETAYENVGLSAAPLMATLQYERKLSAVHLAGKEPVGGPIHQQLMGVRGQVDKYLQNFRSKALSEESLDTVGPGTTALLKSFTSGLEGLAPLRAQIDDRAVPLASATEAYNGLVMGGISVFSSLELADDVEIYRQSDALVSYNMAREFVMQEDVIVSAALAGSGRMTKEQFQTFNTLVVGHRQVMQMSRSGLGPKMGPLMDEVMESQLYQNLTRMEDTLLQASSTPSGRVPAGVAREWSGNFEQLLELWTGNENKAGGIIKSESEPISDRVIQRLVIASGVGLLAILVSVVLSVLLVRSLSKEIGQLQSAAWELAERRLPWVVGRLRRGEDVDVANEVPPLDVGARTTEVAKVADAFNRVQNTAMQTAVGEAHLRKGISRVFLNLAWRSQSLLHRQLRMLDALERKAADPETLNDLFQLDHLTTRMRRHAEGLIILSGAAPGRTWSRPVPMADVLRGAVAEVEDYTRVEATSASPVALTGAAVTDVIHLLAELIENATAYSPPPTEVLVHGEVVGNGYAVEIVDRGVGLTPVEFAELNERLAKAPEFDLADTDRLGLFVVSRLAARHGIKVTLQPSAYGGVSAVVVMPHSLIVPESAIDEQPALEERRPTSTPLEVGTGPYPLPTAPVSAPAAPAPAQSEPARSAQSPLGQTSGVVPPREEGGLPRRVRQRNLAPQLRQSTLSHSGPPEPEDRDPEDSRDLFSSLQAGWQRARNENDEDGYGS